MENNHFLQNKKLNSETDLIKRVTELENANDEQKNIINKIADLINGKIINIDFNQEKEITKSSIKKYKLEKLVKTIITLKNSANKDKKPDSNITTQLEKLINAINKNEVLKNLVLENPSNNDIIIKLQILKTSLERKFEILIQEKNHKEQEKNKLIEKLQTLIEAITNNNFQQLDLTNLPNDIKDKLETLKDKVETLIANEKQSNNELLTLPAAINQLMTSLSNLATKTSKEKNINVPAALTTLLKKDKIGLTNVNNLQTNIVSLRQEIGEQKKLILEKLTILSDESKIKTLDLTNLPNDIKDKLQLLKDKVETLIANEKQSNNELLTLPAAINQLMTSLSNLATKTSKEKNINIPQTLRLLMKDDDTEIKNLKNNIITIRTDLQEWEDEVTNVTNDFKKANEEIIEK